MSDSGVKDTEVVYHKIDFPVCYLGAPGVEAVVAAVYSARVKLRNRPRPEDTSIEICDGPHRRVDNQVIRRISKMQLPDCLPPKHYRAGEGRPLPGMAVSYQKSGL